MRRSAPDEAVAPTRPRRCRSVLALLAVALLGASPGARGPARSAVRTGVETVTVAIVSNPQMEDAISLSPQFEAENPGIRLRFVSLSENEARAKITASVATGGGEFDVVMISNYETPQWAQNGWLTDLQPLIDATPGYDPNDFIPTVRDSLSYQGRMYSVPFYGESSFLMYRKDLFAQAGLTMPAQPTWPQVAELAARLDRPRAGPGRASACAASPAGARCMAPFDTVVNTFGGRWYDPQWRAQLTSPQVEQAAQFYVDLVRNVRRARAPRSPASPSAPRSSARATPPCGTTRRPRRAPSRTPRSRPSSGRSATSPAPVVATPSSGWLYSLVAGDPEDLAAHRTPPWKFMSWMTSKQYMQRVGTQLGWTSVPPGSRLSTYQIPQYQQAAGALRPDGAGAIQQANPQQPTVQPVPYQGVQFVRIPEFQDLGTRVSQQMSARRSPGRRRCGRRSSSPRSTRRRWGRATR